MAWAFGLTIGASSFIETPSMTYAHRHNELSVQTVVWALSVALKHQRDDIREACHEVHVNALSDVSGYFVVIAFIGGG